VNDNTLLPFIQVYLCELVHPDLRGAGAAAYATSHALGYSTFLFASAVAGEDAWRIAPAMMAVAAALPAMAAAFALPESPVWLLRKGREQEALNGLRK